MSLYREKALKKLSSPEQLDQLITVVNPRGWIALAATGLVVVLFVIWLFYGSIPISIDGDGIMTTPGGIKKIVAEESGILKSVNIKFNDIIEKDQVIAEIKPPPLEKRRDLLVNLKLLQDLESRTNCSDIKVELDRFMFQIRKILLEEENYQVKSPMRGKIVSLWASENDYVKIGDTLGVVESPVQNLEALIYMPLAQGKQISPGMKVEISPSIVNEEDFGFIIGEVTRVSEFPETKESMMRYLHNESLVDLFLQKGTQILVHVKPIKDPNTFSGFKWSSEAGPQVKITNDTLCSATITIRDTKPISFFFSIKQK